jgi:long-subunit acyl-CoA synthetase (AMP-forming)
MLGYWNDPVKTKEAIDTAGWMHSGDLATMDEEGYINIVKNQRHDHTWRRKYLSESY